MNAKESTIRLAGAAQGFNWLPVFVAEEQGMFLISTTSRSNTNDSVPSTRRPPQSAKEPQTSRSHPPRVLWQTTHAEEPCGIIGFELRTAADVDRRPARHRRPRWAPRQTGRDIISHRRHRYLYPDRSGRSCLTYPDDYDFVLAGIHTARWEALQNDVIDAAPQPAPWNFLAEREGYALLGEVSDAIPEIIFAAVVGEATWLARNDDLVRRFLLALTEAHDFVNDPANDAVSLPIYQRLTTPDDVDLAGRGLRYTRDLGMWPSGLRVSPRAFAATLDAMIAAGLISAQQRTDATGVLLSRGPVSE